MSFLAELIQTKRILVSCGSGGVGKTTMSAALAIKAAMEGKTAVVITIDPAKRLATSLGLKSLDSEPTDLTNKVQESLKQNDSESKILGRFFAVMPDTSKTFETFILSIAGKNVGLAQRIFCSSIYKIFTRDFSGTNEYMAMEKLFDLYSQKNSDGKPKYDLIVLDTPPSANTKLFLEAPQLFANFFDETIIRWFVNPGSRILAAGLKKVLGILEKITGKGFIAELIEFTTSLFELRTQFLENLNQVAKLLHQSDVSFLMVTSPERLSKKDTEGFLEIIKNQDYPFAGFIMNRMVSLHLGWKDQKDFEKLVMKFGIESDIEPIHALLRREEKASQYLESLEVGQVKRIAEQSKDVHSIEALLKIASSF